MSLQSIYEPINGEEGRKAIYRAIKEKINLMPMMRVGNAYHRFCADIKIIISAYPADVPVPKLDYQALIGLKDVADSTDEKVVKAINSVKKVEALEEVEKSLINALKKVQDTLKLVRPQAVVDLELNAGDTPDQLRIATGQKVPMIERGPQGMRQIYVDPKTLNVNNDQAKAS